MNAKRIVVVNRNPSDVSSIALLVDNHKARVAWCQSETIPLPPSKRHEELLQTW